MNSEPLLPFSFAKDFNVLLEQENETRTLHCTTMPSHSVLVELQRKFGIFTIQNIPKEVLHNKIQNHYESSSASHLDDFQDDAESDESLDALAMDLHEPIELLTTDNDTPIIRLLNALFAQAILEEASDIHIESYEGRIRVRFRVNGTLKQVLEPSIKIAPLLVSRIKVMAKLDIAEKRLPQDGRIAIQLGG